MIRKIFNNQNLIENFDVSVATDSAIAWLPVFGEIKLGVYGNERLNDGRATISSRQRFYLRKS